MKTYIVQLDDHDDVISARDKISWSKARRILLVWPSKGHVLERRVDLLLLKRHGQQLGAQLALVTRNGIVKAQAGELGIPVFTDAVEAQESSWRRMRSRRKLPRRIHEHPAGNTPGLRERRAAGRLAAQQDLFLQAAENRWLRLGLFTLGVLAFLFMLLAFVPGAEVRLKPYRHSQQLTIPVWASPEIRAPNASGGLPAQTIVVTMEGRDQANSTGRANIPDRSATGQVILTNLTDQPVDVPAGSVLLGMSSPKVEFATSQAAQVPAGPGKSVMVGIRAVLPGSAGNLPAGKINALQGPIGLRLSANNPSATRGGSDQTGRAPTEQDYRALRDRLITHLQSSAIEEMRALLKPGQRLLEGTVHNRAIVSETREPAEGQPGDQLQLGIQAEFEALTVNEVDLQAVAQAALDANLEKGFQPAPGSLNLTFVTEPRLEQAAVEETASPVARWSLKIEQLLESSWGKAVVIRSIQGRGVQEAVRILEAELHLAEVPQIRLYPNWWSRLPFLPARIHVVTE